MPSTFDTSAYGAYLTPFGPPPTIWYGPPLDDTFYKLAAARSRCPRCLGTFGESQCTYTTAEQGSMEGGRESDGQNEEESGTSGAPTKQFRRP